MKVTSELIEKYHLGGCSEEEGIAVEDWLASINEEESNLPESSLERMERDIWDSLPGKRQREVPGNIYLYRKLMRYAAVFCLLVVAVIGLKVYQSHFTISNVTYQNTTRDRAMQISKDGFQFTLMPGSKVDFTFNNLKNEAKLSFTGDIKFRKNARDNTHYTIMTEGEAARSIVRKLTLKSDREYFIFSSPEGESGSGKIFIHDKTSFERIYHRDMRSKRIMKMATTEVNI